MRGGDHLGLRVHLHQVEVGVARGVGHLLRLDAVALERRGVAEEVPRVEHIEHVILRKRRVRVDVPRLRVAIHQLRKRAVLLRLPDGVDGLVVAAVGLGRQLHGQQVVVQPRGEGIRPRLVAPALVGQVAVARGIQLLVPGKIGLQVPRGANALRIQPHLLRGVGVDQVALRHAQLLVGGHGVVVAVDPGALEERGVKAACDVLPVLLEQVAVLALIVVQRRERALDHRARIALPIRGKEDVGVLARLQRGQRLGVPISPADQHKLHPRAELWLHIVAHRLLHLRAHAVVLISNEVISQRSRRLPGRGLLLHIGAGTARQQQQQRQQNP